MFAAVIRPSPRSAAVAGLAALAALLGALTATTAFGLLGWGVAATCGVGLCLGMTRALAFEAQPHLGPADLVTLARGLMACAVAGLTAHLLTGSEVTPAILMLTVPALLLDAVDGRVARRTGTVSAFGGRFDGEVDAFLILILSVAAAPVVGWWVLAAGLARYAFVAAGLVLPWLREPLDFRYWRKVAAASVGILLTLAVADLLPRWASGLAAALAAALLSESFGRDVRWLHRRRGAHPRRGVLRGLVRSIALALAGAAGWFALTSPTRPDQVTPSAFVRLPLEGLAAIALLVLAATLARGSRLPRAVSDAVALLLAALALVKLLDLGTFATLDRPFNVVTDRQQFGSGLSFVSDSVGTWAAWGLVIAALLLALALAGGLRWAARRLLRAIRQHRRGSSRSLLALALCWGVLAGTGAQLAPGAPLATTDVTRYVTDKVRSTAAAYRDHGIFDDTIAADSFRDPASGDLALLRGKDVLLVFVESYGRVALEGGESHSIRTLLDQGTTRLQGLGYAAASGYLSSPTFGGKSWLAHASLQSGLTVSDQNRYDQLLTSERTTLSSAFKREGWHTVAVLPSTRGSWPQGRAFYRLDTVYSRADLGYAGPTFGFSTMPDQFTLAALDDLILAPPRNAPVMAEVALTSSHGPWAPLPTTVGWAELGDGSIFHAIRKQAVTAADLWSDRAEVPAAYRTSIAYSLNSLLSFVERQRTDDLVVVLLGDHQPSTIISGYGGNRDVPISILARDPRMLDAIADWGWQAGLRPDAGAPVWPMADFRNRFLSAFSTPGAR